MSEVEFRLINAEDMPPLVITIGNNDEPKVIINQHHHIWLAWKRKIIGGVAKSLYDKIDELLDAYLHEQHKMSEADLWEE
mgnify:FL=1|jgi:hypothetical protein|tara:strand:+ start:363 stop:602 length:240 start_codon:yes stop_codon:yes gene_type:complete